jgi:BCD family chlorophyll transporter-like MFS transporter
MLAYSAQELLVEPFAGLVFGMPPGVTTKLAGLQHGGVLAGMILVAVLASGAGGRALASLKLWTVVGCVASAACLIAIAASGRFGADPVALRGSIFALGLSNGIFAVAAIGSMMGLAGSGAGAREGTRMGLWGAAQALAFGLGGIAGTGLVDLARAFAAPPLTAYALVFVIEAAAFLAAAVMASRIGRLTSARAPVAPRVAVASIVT